MDVLLQIFHVHNIQEHHQKSVLNSLVMEFHVGGKVVVIVQIKNALTKQRLLEVMIAHLFSKVVFIMELDAKIKLQLVVHLQEMKQLVLNIMEIVNNAQEGIPVLKVNVQKKQMLLPIKIVLIMLLVVDTVVLIIHV